MQPLLWPILAPRFTAGAGVFEKASNVQRNKWHDLPRSVRWLTQHHECLRAYSQSTHYQYNPQPWLYVD
jgi:hypothetical protein